MADASLLRAAVVFLFAGLILIFTVRSDYDH